MKTSTTLICAGLMALGLAHGAHAAYNVWTNEYTLSKKDLETAIAPQFPRKLKYMDLFDVTLSHPRPGMDAPNNRLTTVVDAEIANQWLLARPVNAVLTMSSGFKYDAPSRSLRLDAPKVENVDSKDLPPQYAQQLTALGNAAADQLLRDYAVYTFTPEQLQMNGKRFEPGKITVEKEAVKVEIIEQ